MGITVDMMITVTPTTEAMKRVAVLPMTEEVALNTEVYVRRFFSHVCDVYLLI